MNDYVRPTFERREFRDAAGTVIDYGNRWWPPDPPDEAYSRVSDPERFAPLHTVADALVAHLSDTYEVSVETDPDVSTDPLLAEARIERAVRLTPAAPDAAPLTVAYTDLPGLILRAGALFEQMLPDCGCDACDDDPDALLDVLEQDVFAIVEGRLTETLGHGRHPTYTDLISEPDGERGHSGWQRTDLDRAALRSARAILAAAPNGWRPWPRREGA